VVDASFRGPSLVSAMAQIFFALRWHWRARRDRPALIRAMEGEPVVASAHALATPASDDP
jgi:hypothetical protein